MDSISLLYIWKEGIDLLPIIQSRYPLATITDADNPSYRYINTGVISDNWTEDDFDYFNGLQSRELIGLWYIA